MKYHLGFDIGGSSLKAVLVKNLAREKSKGRKIIKSEIEDLPDNLEKLLYLVSKIVSDFTIGIKPTEIEGIGFALAGVLDLKREKMLVSPNIKYLNNQPIKKLLVQKLKPYRIKIEHDVHCFLLAETRIGLAKFFKNVFYLTLGTGIGGAWMVDGKIILGSHGAAGEIGHMIINLKTIKGEDLEELAANKFIKKWLGIGSIEARQRAQAGDKKAREIFAQLGQNLGIGLANIINIFDPEAIVLSGGLIEAKEFIWPTAKEEIEKFVISPAAKKTKILFSQLGQFGGAIGATLLFSKPG